MKKVVKIFSFSLLLLAIAVFGFFIYCVAVIKDVKIDETKLLDAKNRTAYYDAYGNFLDEETSGNSFIELKNLPPYVEKAFIAIEDKRFYSHNGIDVRGMARAAFNNILSFSFKEGASTITQQLIKNTHLSGEKTFKRKISEIKLALDLEKKYSKEQIIETYLNTIYFGNDSFGISEAAQNYFGKKAENLTLNEAAALAGIIKAPSTYSPFNSPEKCFERKKTVLKEMLLMGFITEKEYNDNYSLPLTLTTNEKTYSYSHLLKKELDGILKTKLNINSGYKVYTYYDKNVQEIIEKSVKNSKINYDYSVIFSDNKSHVLAYCSTVGDMERQLGSTIKPILCYAPAVEYDGLSPLTPILDEKVSVNGITVENYKNAYYGFVSAKTSLSKSLNSCAVKLLNSTGIEKAKNFAIKAGINLNDNDKDGLIALGSTNKGTKLTKLISAYNVFSCEGKRNDASFIKKIIDKNGKTIYVNKDENEYVCSEQTAFLLSDMLKETCKSGTGKTLKNDKYELCAKTGTVGNENGNTDAYTVSYCKNYTLACWIGTENSSYMDNSVTGGTIPAKISNNVWQKLSEKYDFGEFKMPNGIVEVKLDRISYENNNALEIADDFSPERFVLKGFFNENKIPKTKSKRFSLPKMLSGNLSVNNKGIYISLCLSELINARIYKEENGKNTELFDTKNMGNGFLDTNLNKGKKYAYYAIPYYENEGEKISGEKVLIGEILFGENDWWVEE